MIWKPEQERTDKANGHKDCLPQWHGETRAEKARREKNAVRASAVENWSTALRGPNAAGVR